MRRAFGTKRPQKASNLRKQKESRQHRARQSQSTAGMTLWSQQAAFYLLFSSLWRRDGGLPHHLASRESHRYREQRSQCVNLIIHENKAAFFSGQ